MLISVKCPHCGASYPPRTQHTCRPPSLLMRVKPIRNGTSLDAPDKPQDPVRPKTLSYD